MDLELIVEVGCEEIPARFIEPLLQQLSHRLRDRLSENALSYGKLETFGSPRRLVLHLGGLTAVQSDRTEVITGPPVTTAFDSENQPTRAAEGFARKMGVSVSQLIRVENDKGEYLGYEKHISGKSAREILSKSLNGLYSGLELPKNMRWEESGFLFVRPIRWILCLLGGQVLDLELAGVKAANRTHGHRILAKDIEVEVSGYEEYRSLLLKNRVVIDPAERRAIIEGLLIESAVAAGGNLAPDPELLGTVTYLNEHPSVVCGQFDSSYLRIPREVLVTVMREHQKYFSLQDSAGRLLPRFVAVVDSEPGFHRKIISGHERVLRARLADAAFFWEQDRKVALKDRCARLKHVIFQAKLGTVLDKSRRVDILCQTLARQLKRKDLGPGLAEAARLSKADLTTDMVKEFPNLQGIMGGLYARAEGLSEEVAQAIYDHYRPNSMEDESPRTIQGGILSIADKLDSVIAAFSIGIVPSGSKDLLALRRQTMGIVKILLELGLSVSIRKAAHRAFLSLKKWSERPFDETYADFEAFFKERLKFIFREQGFQYDEINAIVEVGSENPVECLQRLKAMAAMRGSEDFIALAGSFKRIKNIIVKAGIALNDPFVVNAGLFQQEEEALLYGAVEKIRSRMARYQRAHQYTEVFQSMAGLRPQVDRFFDKVLVMAPEPDLQRNRVGIIGLLLQMFLEVADISEIVVN